MVILLVGSPISAEDFQSSVRVTFGFLVTFLTKVVLAQILSLTRQPILERVLALPRSIPCHNFSLQRVPWTSWLGFCPGTHCKLWDLICTGLCLSTVTDKSLVAWVQIDLKCPSNIFLINIFLQEMAHLNPNSFWNNVFGAKRNC